MKTIEMMIDNIFVVVHYNDLNKKEDIEEACIQFIKAVDK